MMNGDHICGGDILILNSCSESKSHTSNAHRFPSSDWTIL